MLDLLCQLFDNDAVAFALVRQYHFISETIQRLERELERHHKEQYSVYDYMMNNPSFCTRLQPVVLAHRLRTQRSRPHPYKRTSSPPKPSDDRPPSSNASILSYYPTATPLGTQSNPILINDDEILDGRDSPLPSVNKPLYNPFTQPPSPRIRPEEALVDLLPPSSNFGSQNNTIRIDDDEDLCSRCGKGGHQREDCDALLRSFEKCGICQWKKRDVKDCDHYDVTPAWVKKQNAKLAQQG